jgi:DNA polymerase III epsilon subunit-like protein
MHCIVFRYFFKATSIDGHYRSNMSTDMSEAKKQHNAIVVDTETTGFPTSRTPNPLNSDHFVKCRMLSVSWCVVDCVTGAVVKDAQTLVCIPGETWVHGAEHIHGLSEAFVRANGVSLLETMHTILTDIRTHNVDTLVAHNVTFDANVLINSAHRCTDDDDDFFAFFGLTELQNLKQVCTSKLWGKGNNYYNTISLKDAVAKHLGENQLSAHQALQDMEYCKRLYQLHLMHEERRLNVWEACSPRKRSASPG